MGTLLLEKGDRFTHSVIWEHFFGVIASEAWQSRREKLYYYGNEDIFFMRLPRFARNDTLTFNIIDKSVT